MSINEATGWLINDYTREVNMKAEDTFTVSWCGKHKNWWVTNCPDCMVDSNEEAIKQQGRREVVESLPNGLFVADMPPEEGKPYSHLGCYILRWGKGDEPTIGLYRLSDNEEWQTKLKKWEIEQ